jgi:hypothetical protein
MFRKVNVKYVVGLACDKYTRGETFTYPSWESAFAKAIDFTKANHLYAKAYTVTKMVITKNWCGKILSIDSEVLAQWSEL